MSLAICTVEVETKAEGETDKCAIGLGELVRQSGMYLLLFSSISNKLIEELIVKNITTLRACLGSIIILASLFGMTAQAYQGEVFVCSLVGSSDTDDILKARDNYVKVADKAEITLPPSFLWSKIKGGTDTDTLWFNFYENAAQYGAFTDAAQASSSLVDAVAEFSDVVDCDSYLLNQQDVYTGPEELHGPYTYIDSHACNFRKGAGPASLPDLKAHIKDYLDAAGTHKSFRLFQQNSMTPTPNSPDVRFFGVHNNAADWGGRQDSLASTDGGQMLLRHWNAVLDCSTAHWSGQQVVEGPAAAE